MAQKLHDQYGYSYATVQVLLGGWSGWKAAGYPTASGGAAAPLPESTRSGGQIVPAGAAVIGGSPAAPILNTVAPAVRLNMHRWP